MLVTLGLCAPAGAFAQAKAGVVTTLEGSATAARAALPQPVALKFKDDVFQNDRVVTGDRSIVRMLLGGKAVVTVRERSALTITEVPGKSTIDLDAGKIAVAVAKERMRPGESIEVRTPNAVAAVRGTVFVIEVIRTTAALDAAQAGVTTHAYGFAGSVLMNFSGQILNLLADTFASGTGTGLPTFGTMTPEMRRAAQAGLQPGAQTVGGGQEGARDQALGVTVATFSEGGGPDLGGTAPSPTVQPTVTQPPILPEENLGGGGTTSSGGGGKSAGATGILVFGDLSTVTVIPGILGGLGHAVTLTTSTLPADLSAFGTIWHVGQTTALTSAEQTRLKDHLATGGGLHLTGEHQAGCCGALNASVQSFLRSVVSGGGAIVTADPGFGAVSGPYPFNTTALGGVTTTPNALAFWSPSATGGIGGISGANVLVTGAGSVPVGGVWKDSDLVTGTGRLTLLMDSNWMDGYYTDPNAVTIIENLETFIDDPPTRLSLTQPLLRSVNEQFDSSTFLTILGYAVSSASDDPLLWFTGTRVAASVDFLRLIDSSVTTRGSLLRLEDGAQIVQTGVSTPLVSMRGGSLDIGTGGTGHLFDLSGRAEATQVDPETGLTLGTDRPLQPGAESPVFEGSDGAVVNVRGSAYHVDRALLEATAPLLSLKAASAFATARDAIDLTGGTRVSIPNDAITMISVNASTLTVNGNLVKVSGGSRLDVAGSLLGMSNGSTVNILNGVLLSVTDNSVANVGRLVTFTGTGNLLNVTNTLAPTAMIGGIPVYGPADSVRVSTPNAFAGLGTAGTIRINGVTLTPTTPLASLSGSLVATQNGGRVKIGP